TYAMWWIRASIQEYILRSWSLVKIGTTAAQKKLFFNLRRLKGEINAIDGGSMTSEQVSEIADRLGVQENEVEMMDGRMSTGDQSLNAPMRGRGAEGEDGGEWQDWLEDSAESQEAVLAEEDELNARRRLLMTTLATLNEREADILQARRLQDEPETLEQLSEKFGVSRERIRQIEARAFEKLRSAMTEQAEKSGLIEG
ncbi:MAG: sigma factor-like helix-turn-helix DNA-binding protein, partial [Pseudomonadota bacterium]|nr:sigma factor-like helix-turn-helix DNA-binding protein [Pseudomonadota bacterium]